MSEKKKENKKRRQLGNTFVIGGQFVSGKVQDLCCSSISNGVYYQNLDFSCQIILIWS